MYMEREHDYDVSGHDYEVPGTTTCLVRTQSGSRFMSLQQRSHETADSLMKPTPNSSVLMSGRTPGIITSRTIGSKGSRGLIASSFVNSSSFNHPTLGINSEIGGHILNPRFEKKSFSSNNLFSWNWKYSSIFFMALSFVLLISLVYTLLSVVHCELCSCPAVMEDNHSPLTRGEDDPLRISCPILCSGRGHYSKGVCICNEGWKGKECNIRQEDCESNCSGRGTCVQGTCSCDVGFTGVSCQVSECPLMCSGRGTYSKGKCHCRTGFKGVECQLLDSVCDPSDCSHNGVCVSGECSCFPGFKGPGCQEIDCLDPSCGGRGVCLDGKCLCREGWRGDNCTQYYVMNSTSGSIGITPAFLQQDKCSSRCSHGKCVNETCVCNTGFFGKNCGLSGCPSSCSGASHGECIKSKLAAIDSDASSMDGEDMGWTCSCREGWSGPDCSLALESNCSDEIDNDNDGLVDCADSECCSRPECKDSLMCLTSPEPLDILLRKQPPSPTASFFQKMQFLIDEDGVQNYARENAFSEGRASVIRGRVLSPSSSGLIGVRVGVANDPQLGFVLSREGGWFDLMVNGGSAVVLHFQREPFRQTEKTVSVSSNEIVFLDPVVMNFKDFNHMLTTSQTFDPSKDLFYTAKASHNNVCIDHDYVSMKPLMSASWKNYPCGHRLSHRRPRTDHVKRLLSDGSVVSDSLALPGTEPQLYLIYNSSRASGFKSLIDIILTPDRVPNSLTLVHLKVRLEGTNFEKTFEADASLKYTYSWNRRNVYKQKVYGMATAVVSVGYEYSSCPGSVIWETSSIQLPGHDMSISEVGGWNLNIHHRYNFQDGILQKGDGSNIYLKKKATPNSEGDYEIITSESREVYVFNRHGMHVSTKSLDTNTPRYNFTYVGNTSFAKLSSVTDSSGNKIQLLRDYSNTVKEIESSMPGSKCRLEMSRTGRLLESFYSPSGSRVSFSYNGITGLIKSKSDTSSGATITYDYDRNGRLVKAEDERTGEPVRCPL